MVADGNRDGGRPGPDQAGRRLSAEDLSILAVETALRVAVVSLADSLKFGLVADPTLLGDVDHLASAMQAEAAALTACLPAG